MKYSFSENLKKDLWELRKKFEEPARQKSKQIEKKIYDIIADPLIGNYENVPKELKEEWAKTLNWSKNHQFQKQKNNLIEKYYSDLCENFLLKNREMALETFNEMHFHVIDYGLNSILALIPNPAKHRWIKWVKTDELVFFDSYHRHHEELARFEKLFYERINNRSK